MITRARCWGGPAHGEWFPINKTAVVVPVFDPVSVRWDEPLGPIGPSYTEVCYRPEKVGWAFSGKHDLPDDGGITSCDYDVPRDMTYLTCAVWLRPNDELTKAEILGGLRVVALLAGWHPRGSLT